VSVAVTDEFMKAVESGSSFAQRNPRTGQEVRRLDAASLWRHIAETAWQSGEPGVLFIDRVNAANPTPALGDMESTNPCGELPLLPFESCNLGSLNVARFVGPTGWDFPGLAEGIRCAVRFLDDVIDINRYPLPQIEEITRANRKIGLGVMGFADALIQMDVPYDSERAVELADGLMAFCQREARAATAALAVERGPFPNFLGSRWDRPGAPPLRHATTTTIAPTGTISILAGCSSGIEPLYALSFVRRVLDGERLVEIHPQFLARSKREGWYSDGLMDQLSSRGSVRGLDGVPEAAQRVFATAYDVAPEWHVRMQATFQAHVDNSVSKTINLPRTAEVADVARVYTEAYRLGCKGVTVFRDGSRDNQVLSFGQSAQDLGPSCPECGETKTMAHEGSCQTCPRCGHSACL
jgi:ribonucleoside-diphosphate reductase alpha chain